MHQTFIQYLGESLDDLASGRAGRTRVTRYPKTNTKRFMDDWNRTLGPWVDHAQTKGHRVEKRVNSMDGPLVLDVIDGDKLLSTAVVKGHDEMHSGQHTIDFYNQTDVHQHNKYRVIPNETAYEDGYEWQPMQMDGASHQDTRNVPMSDKDIANTGRVNDTDTDADEPMRKERPLPSSRSRNADAAGAWGKITKPRPGRKT